MGVTNWVTASEGGLAPNDSIDAILQVERPFHGITSFSLNTGRNMRTFFAEPGTKVWLVLDDDEPPVQVVQGTEFAITRVSRNPSYVANHPLLD